MESLIENIESVNSFDHANNKDFIKHLRKQLKIILDTLKEEQQSVKNHYNTNVESLKETIINQQEHI